MASDNRRDDGPTSTDGQVYVWHGYQNISPRSFDVFRNIPITHVAIGSHHCAFLTSDLEVFTYGNNQHGQLGDGTFTDCLREPKLIDALKDQEVLTVSCGARHTGAVTCGGDVYCWGDSTSGQCGLGQTGRYPEPRLVKITETLTPCSHGVSSGEERRVTIQQISCGDVHTLVLSDVGEIWAWGMGVQLGLNRAEKVLSPHKVEYLEGRKVLSVACGVQHSLALVEKLKAPSSDRKSPSSESGRSSDSGLSARSLTGLTISRSRSGSPVVNNTIQVHKVRPSTCVRCQQEIYTYTETTDACIISTKHKCPLGLDIKAEESGKGRILADVLEVKPVDPVDDHEESGNDDSSCQSTPDKKAVNVTVADANRDKNSDSGFSNPETEELDVKKESDSLGPQCEDNKQVVSDKSESDLTDSDHGEQLEYVKLEESSPVRGDVSCDGAVQETSLGGELATTEPPQTCGEITKRCRKSPDLEILTNSSSHTGGSDTLASLLRGDKERTSSSSQPAECTITKSRSSFLDENEAKECLEKLLYGDEDLREAGGGRSSEQEEPSSPFVKNIENILQYVPSSPAAVQEYVTNLTKNVVSNIKTSIDRFSFVSSQNSLDLESMSKSSSQDSINLAAAGGGSKTPKEDATGLRSKGEGHMKGREDDFLGLGSMTRSASLGSFLKAKMNAERKASLPAGELNLFKVGGTSSQTVALDTEVWSWGRGRHGQLGHGDLLDRRTPCCIKSLVDKRVTKIAAGAHHCAVVTANSQVLTWGAQSEGQLGHIDANTSVPNPIKVALGSQPLWDVATGHAHTVVVMDSTSFTPDVLYTGKQPSGEEVEGRETQKTLHMMRLASLKKCGWIKQVVAGGDLCACLTDRNTNGNVATLHEFAATERLYHCRLDIIATNILNPFINSEHYKKQEGNMYDINFKQMVDSFTSLLNTVARTTIELAEVIQGSRELESLTMLAHSEEHISVFQNFSRYFGDTLALGGFEYITKTASNESSSVRVTRFGKNKNHSDELEMADTFFDKVREHFIEVLEETKVDRSNMAVTLRRLMQVPLHRLKDYSKHISKVALRYPAYTAEHGHLSQLSQLWDSLKQSASTEHNMAENTRKFWEACPPKFAEALRHPGRRLVRESKGNPISIPSSGRFSMHWLILFSDVFVHGQYSMHQTFPLPTIWVEAVSDSSQLKNAITLTMPEEVLILTAPSASDKAEWLWAFNQAIDKALSDQKQQLRPRVDGARLTPPLARQAKHVFYKNASLKEAKYVGMWLAGKMHGHGELTWPDGRRYVGKFKQGLQHGHGIYTTPKDPSETEVYDGHWKGGKMHGLGTVKYANGDVYEGYFKEGRKHGHGVMKRGKITSGSPPIASIYIGEWVTDKKCGYGVLDDISKGQKYMGMWQDDTRHGNGIIVTLDCMYFEGSFTHDKMSGFGLLMTEDNSYFEGDFSGGPNLHGKGTLTLPNGDYIEGHFSGSFTEGIKIKDGMFYKTTEPLTERKGFTHSLGLVPTTFGKLAVAADWKWEDIFHHCYTILGCHGDRVVETSKAWEIVAVMVSNGRKALKDDSKRSKVASDILEQLEKIPRQTQGTLSVEDYDIVRNYLTKAFETPFHPLGKLMEGLVDVYRATYMGIGAHHPRLLTHAVAEVKSYVTRIYPLVRLLFPSLPNQDHHQVFTIDTQQDDNPDQDSEDSTTVVVVTAGCLLYPLLLPKIYPPLFTLYALYNEKEDERYWKRLTQWNKQSDMGLMAALGMDQKFWLIDESMLKSKQQLSSVKDKCYRDPTETLQHISTSFSPEEKLRTIKETFNAINKEVQLWIGPVQWCMDELFPVFLFVVVRAGIRHLGAEIHFIDDLMEPHLEHGELGIMFTTLKACYHQIQIEKI